MLYRVTTYTPNPYEPCHEATDSRLVGTRRAAELAAKSILRPHARYETDYSARTTRYPYCTVRPVAKVYMGPDQGNLNLVGSEIDRIEPTLTYVRSVGDMFG
jgi:hypothetical protein